MAIKQIPKPNNMTVRYLPILHLNGYKISATQQFSHVYHTKRSKSFFKGCGWEPYFVEGDDPMTMHRKLMAETMDTVIEEDQGRSKRMHVKTAMTASPSKVAYDCSSYTKGLDRSKGC